MARPAPIRLAGVIAATAMCVAAATEASAQSGSLVLNNQLQLGDVISGQTLNVTGASDQVTVTNSAQGNTLAGSVQNDSLSLRSTQTMRGNAAATTELSLGGNTSGVVNAHTYSGGNSIAASAYGATLDVDSNQTVDAVEVTASTAIRGGTARLLNGGEVDATAVANTAALGGTGTRITGSVVQASDASARASNLAETQYIPASASFSTQAVNNAIAVSSPDASSIALSTRQRSGGDDVVADTSANAGNAWDLAGRANAAANQSIVYNRGGSVVLTSDQDSVSAVRASAVVTAYDFGAATASAHGVGNTLVAGNNDAYIEIDNTQVNSGGVDVSASFEGTNGYDAYVNADAAGNSVTGYACSECRGTLNATNTQTNSAAVSATATANVYGTGRAVISGSNAVGNAATFYVSRPASGN